MNATARPLNIYGETLSGSIYQSPRYDIPSIGTFLSQGGAIGALLALLWPVAGMLSDPENGYNFLLISYLPLFLGAGMLFGLCEGAAMWTGTFVVGHRINAVARTVLGMVILVLLIVAYDFLFTRTPPHKENISVTDYLYALRVHAGCGMVLGLVIGSRFRPLYELIRGTTADRWPGISGLTGLLLRVFVIFSLMVSILSLILSLQGDFDRIEFTMAVIALSHFAVAAVIVFARIPFWLLLPLAIIVNFPVAVLITDVLTEKQTEIRVLSLVYLHLWAAFLLCRVSLPKKPRFLTRKEITER